MKLFVVVSLLPALAFANLCPDGYEYAGADYVPTNASQIAPDPRYDVDALARSGTYYIEEVDRSEMYSCYKLVTEQPADWISAEAYCGKEEAQLASFESDDEMVRVRDHFIEDFQPKESENKALPTGLDVFTSGMFFQEVQNWYWIASNRSVSKDRVFSNDEVPSNKPNLLKLDINGDGRDLEVRPIKTCLNYRMTGPSELPILVDSSCFEAKPFMCEARVQTVTYYTWFRANWVDFMLGFLLVILFVALCIAVCSFTSRDYGNPARRNNNTRTRTTTVGVAHVDPMAQHSVYAADMPPAYDQTVIVHKPDSAAGQPAAQMSRYDSFKVKSKEMGSKVFYYKPGTSKTTSSA